MIFNKKKEIGAGFTLVEVVVGIFLLLIVFAGIVGAYRLGLRVVGLSKNKITAIAIANHRIEMIRNLPYESVGIVDAVLPQAAGILEPAATETRNDVTFTVAVDVQFATDPADGEGESDSCNWDYKKASITVSWNDLFPGQISMSTNIAPRNQVQETQTCLNQPGGILSIRVFDAVGVAVPSPLIEVYNPASLALVDSATPTAGEHSFPLPVGTYRVDISKDGYSGIRTYGVGEIASPDNQNPTVLDGYETDISLSIDRTSLISVDGLSPSGQGNFGDSFEDGALVSEINNTEIAGGSVRLSGSPYAASGYVISNEIAPGDLVAWNELTFNDVRPAMTHITYQVLYFDGMNWVLVPEHDLSGNGAGFGSSPVQLSGLSAGLYPRIKIKGNLSTEDTSATPQVNNWQVVWTASAGVPVPNAPFHLRGEKTIGRDESENKVYKYSQDLSLDGSGHSDLSGMEWDSYTFAVDPASGFSLLNTDPAPQPVNVAPNATAAVKLYLQAQNALLVTVQNDQTLRPVFSATARLVNTPIGYDATVYTGAKGQAYFAPLQSGTYSLEVQAAGYTGYSGVVNVSGESATIVNIHQNE